VTNLETLHQVERDYNKERPWSPGSNNNNNDEVLFVTSAIKCRKDFKRITHFLKSR
jgi:hypothetical protein